MNKRRIYLAGPMTGYDEHNYPAFRAAAADLRGQGHYVYSPHEHYGPEEYGAAVLRQAFADYAVFICGSADTIVLLPGWGESRGAKVEHALAMICGLDVLQYDDSMDMIDILPMVPLCQTPFVDQGSGNHRGTFSISISKGFEAILDNGGRATGEARPIDPNKL